MCRRKCHFDKLSKSAIRSALALLGAKLWTSELWLSKSAASLPLPLAPCLPLAFPLPSPCLELRCLQGIRGGFCWRPLTLAAFCYPTMKKTL